MSSNPEPLGNRELQALITAAIKVGIDPYEVMVDVLREMGYTVTPPDWMRDPYMESDAD